MSEKNKALAARIPLEAFNQGKLEVIDEVVADSSVDHDSLPPGMPPGMPPPSRPEPIVARYIISWFPVISVLMLVPVLTMRLFSEEHRTGTLEMMLTAPVEEAVVVLSKFLAALVLFLAVWVPWGLYLVALRVEGGTAFDYRPVVGFAVALLFSGAAFVSMGLFFSSLTKNQLAAAVFTFVFMFALFLISVWRSSDTAPGSGLLSVNSTTQSGLVEDSIRSPAFITGPHTSSYVTRP